MNRPLTTIEIRQIYFEKTRNDYPKDFWDFWDEWTRVCAKNDMDGISKLTVLHVKNIIIYSNWMQTVKNVVNAELDRRGQLNKKNK